ncbi:glycosyltransferase [Dokdonella soli]|uniref:glycosyltransferase n=1 Tax=Dokdonella soli TaxID=529810 RepID=UPI0036D22C6C
MIHGAMAPQFHRIDLPHAAFSETLNRLGIHRSYVLYTGNDDFRKNTAGALEAFARLPESLRSTHQFVFNQIPVREEFDAQLQRFGLSSDEVVVTGHVSDADLVVLLNACEVFLFPSLYEGFGLPVLEAMACGAPVLGGDNSSIVELIEDPAARFDARDPAAVSGALGHALSDADFRRECGERGLQRAKAFSWERSARRVLDELDEAVRRKQATFRGMAAPRRKLAVFTPLPPERTGIANYSAELLPELAKRFTIDIYTTAEYTDDFRLSPNFRIRPWQEFAECADRYDGVIYQIGNSPFHVPMFDLLEDHPGIVVLHDFFLSSAYAWLDQHGGRPGSFARELEHCHGAIALRSLADLGIAEAKRIYPCSRRVVERSLGIIAHSPGIHALLAKYGGAHLARPIRVIPHLRTLRPQLARADCVALRSRLGYADGDWVVCSFGFIADTKLSDRLIEAMVVSGLQHDRSVHLVFVGELDGGKYGELVRELVRNSAMAERIRITGFVDTGEYNDYLGVADVAVQLRTHSRGETSGAVLDCLAHGLPTVVNAHATMNDYPSEVVLRIGEAADTAELSTALRQLREDPLAAHALGKAGRAHIGKEHAPAKVAVDYAAAIEEFLQRDDYLGVRSVTRDIADALDVGPSRGEGLDPIAACESLIGAGNPTPTLIVDLSDVVRTDYGTGIHRVVRNLTRELIDQHGSGDARCLPAALDGNSYLVAGAYARDRLGRGGYHDGERIVFGPGNTLLMLDSAWSDPWRFTAMLREADARGTEIVGFVYDLIPVRHPETCVPFMPEVFRKWLEQTVRMSHAIVCISRATADDLAAYIEEAGLPHRSGLRIHYVHLGCDLDGEPLDGADAGLKAVFDRTDRPVFLNVGTLEPRKGHADVLDAFEHLWADGEDAALYLVGKTGWNMESFTARLTTHPEFGKRVFWRERSSDADLDYAYRHASALIQASYAEGFGLPLLEAARHGTALLCSDLPVFREVAGDDATWFAAGCHASIAEAVRQFLRSQVQGRKKPASRHVRTWKDAAGDLVRVLGAYEAYRTL